MFVKKWVVAAFVILLFSELAEALPYYALRIRFTNKKDHSHRLTPSTFLSQRSLERRLKQGISLDETDFPVSSEYINQIISLTHGTLHCTSRWLNSCVIWTSDTTMAASLRTQPFISSVEFVAYKDQISTENKNPKIAKTPAFKTTGNPAYYGDTWTQNHLVNGDCLHDKGWKGQGMLIAVLDDGFHYVDTAPAFDSVYDSGRIIDTRNFVQGGNDVFTSFLVHGTTVFSTMAANAPNVYVGAAPLAEYALYATEDPSGEWPIEMDNLVAAFERADSIGADVISTSTGYNNFDPPFQNQSIPQSQMDGKTTVAAIGANIAAQKGMLVVITAGNEGSTGLLTPGDADSALTIGNVNASKIPASNSGYGPNAAAHIKPEVCALGSPGYVITNSLSPYPSSGTSISTPQIAGFAACLWQGSAGKTNSQIRQAIIQSSHLYPFPQMPQLGYGVPDFCNANTILDIENLPAATSVQIAPNPFLNSISVSLTVSSRQNLHIAITDIAGKSVFVTERIAHAGNNALYFQLPPVAAGVYLCRLTLNEYTRVVKLVKQ